MVRFLGSSVFLHAYLKPKRKLTPAEETLKNAAAEIIKRVEEGEEVATSVVHISEAMNIVETRLGLEAALRLLENLLGTENIAVIPVDRGDFEQALALATRYDISPNDAVAALLSRDHGITEVYSFDKHLDKAPFVKRLSG